MGWVLDNYIIRLRVQFTKLQPQLHLVTSSGPRARPGNSLQSCPGLGLSGLWIIMGHHVRFTTVHIKCSLHLHNLRSQSYLQHFCISSCPRIQESNGWMYCCYILFVVKQFFLKQTHLLLQIVVICIHLLQTTCNFTNRFGLDEANSVVSFIDLL